MSRRVAAAAPAQRRRRVTAAAALVLCMVAGLVGAAAAGPAPIRVMTYNIHAGAGADNVFDLDRLAAQINTEHPDLVGLQEVDRHWDTRSQFTDEPAKLARRTGMHAFFAPIYSLDPATPGAPRREFGVAVLSRSPILLAVNHQITRLSTQDPNATPAPAPGFAEVLVAPHGHLLRFYTTHLDYRPDPAVRTAQVADTLRIMHPELPGIPQVITGDFNAAPSAPELAPLRRDLRDEWPGPGGATYPATAPTTRLDQILGSPGLTATAATVPDTLASDHRPVVIDLAP